ncbi:amidophosphoribosyltransferase [Sesbania bispinosa]|nr:amidophosphoribosyltransferase [Sesbania bispinosa]
MSSVIPQSPESVERHRFSTTRSELGITGKHRGGYFPGEEAKENQLGSRVHY